MSYATLLDNDCKNHTGSPWQDQVKNQRGQSTQLAISIIFGLSAFLTFCTLRPRWTQLYHARRKQSKSAQILPELPKSFFGWIPVVYRISKEEVLAAAGLDAFAFLAFFRYAIKFLSIVLFFALVVILPVNSSYGEDKDKPYWWWPPLKNDTGNLTMSMNRGLWMAKDDDKPDKHRIKIEKSYLWMYVVFAYFFTAVALYFLVAETKYLIKMRQAYLAIQSTVTDRTIRLSGIPPRLRSEEKLKGFVEELGIGKVDSVILCRNWAKLDSAMEKRTNCLRKLEEALTKYYGTSRSLRRQYRQPAHNPHSEDHHDDESTSLLISSQQAHSHQAEPDRPRPQHTIRYGTLNLRSKTIDAIDYWEEKLRRYDDKISRLRQEEYEPTPLAFVTMESIAACQMAIQASLDPVPGQLLARAAPSPADVIWSNTYLSRNTRMVRSWFIMLVTGFLSIFWVLLLIPPAGLLSDTVVDKFFPGLKNCDSAEQVHPIANALVRTTLPTLYITLLSVGVPYLYDWMSYMQGMTSQSDVELSIVSKNFFFVFFNLFVVFTLFSSAGEFYDFYNELKQILKDTSVIALAIANAIPSLADFYVNLIILQGLGLLAFRLLEFGSVALYPFYLLSARTPRDHADLRKAPEFRYGFYLPQSMLIFVICTVYSLLPKAWLVIVFGLIYFLIASFIYKYQLLYAMEHRQHSTGRLWPMICNRIILGLVMFHVAVAGLLGVLQAFTQAVLIVPLILATVWFTVYFQRTYFPLMYFIALRSIVRDEVISIPEPSESAWDRATDQGRAVDNNPATGLRYMNPNLTQPLETLWVRKRVPDTHPDQPV